MRELAGAEQLRRPALDDVAVDGRGKVVPQTIGRDGMEGNTGVVDDFRVNLAEAVESRVVD